MGIDRVTNYARDVCGGKIIAGKTQLSACKRHLNDLKRQDTEEFPYFWNVEAANKILEFAETLVIAEGKRAEPFKLFGFQDFIFGSWNGWLTKEGYRRFRTSYVQVARQNGKSIGNAIPALFYSNFDGYNYPQIYCVATKELQARIVLKECIKFIEADEELCGTTYDSGLFSIKEYKSLIKCNLTNGEIKALGRDTSTIDGFRPYFGSVDEYHKHKTNQMYKLLTDGTKKMSQCLISVITTAGFDLNSPCFKLYEYCKKVSFGSVNDESQFVFICELDENDDPFDESVWIKANPLWTKETHEALKADAIKAMEMGGEEELNFLTKSLNKWVTFVQTNYIDFKFWEKCASSKKLEDFSGYSCFAGLDLSSGGDLTSIALVFPYYEQDTKKYYVYSHSFIPSKRVEQHSKKDFAPYKTWINKGLLTVTETLSGIKTDYKYIIAHLKNIIEKYRLDLKMICYDPHNASAFLADLNDLGYDTLQITQSAKSLNDATIDFRLEVEAGNVQYEESNELLTWSIVNAKTTSNSFGEIKIDKESERQRIDPIDAIIDAWKMAISTENVDTNELTEDYFEMMGW